MKLNFRKSKKDRGGVVLVALLALSFGAVGALVFVQLIATRAQMVDSANNALQRRVVLSNSKVLAKQYLYDQVLPAPFSSHPAAVSFELTDGSSAWAQFAMGAFSDTQYPPTLTPLTRFEALDSSGNENININAYLNRFSYGHNSRAYTVRPEIRLGDGVALMTIRGEEDTEVVGGEDPADAFRVFQHRMTFFIKARSPIVAGDGVYTLANDDGQAAGSVFGASGSLSIEGRAFHTAATSLTGSNYEGSGENLVGAVPGFTLGASASGPGVSNFPDTVHTWGRAGLVTEAADYEGRLPIPSQQQEFDRFRSGADPGGELSYRRISEDPSGTYPGFDGAADFENVPVLVSRTVRFDALDFNTVPPTRLPDETYRNGAVISVDPNHDDAKIPTGVPVFPSGTDMAQAPGRLEKISQTMRQVGGVTINTLRINLNTLTDPVFVDSGVEELEIIGNGTYDGDNFVTNANTGALIIVIAQPQELQRVRFYGSRNDHLLYLSILNTSPTPPASPTQLKWWWHDTTDFTASPRPSFRLFAEVYRSILDFQFAGLDSDVEVIGGFRHSNDLIGGSNTGNRLVIAPEFIDPTVTSAFTLSRIERTANRVGWVETYITAGAEGDRPAGTF